MIDISIFIILETSFIAIPLYGMEILSYDSGYKYLILVTPESLEREQRANIIGETFSVDMLQMLQCFPTHFTSVNFIDYIT